LRNKKIKFLVFFLWSAFTSTSEGALGASERQKSQNKRKLKKERGNEKKLRKKERMKERLVGTAR
jgi:Mg2+/Co2+ transporter CorB